MDAQRDVSAQPTASAKRRGLPGLGFAAHATARAAVLGFQLCAASGGSILGLVAHEPA